jgi:hypothetical protein
MNPEIDPTATLASSIKRKRQLADHARAELIAATPILVNSLRNHSGQSQKIKNILWSVWSDEHPVSLCDTLAGLDTDLAVAVLALIAARAHLDGDADELLRTIINYDLPCKPAIAGEASEGKTQLSTENQSESASSASAD